VRTAEDADVTDSLRRTGSYDRELMKRIFVPFEMGLGAARHIAWYVSYQVTGSARAQ
jgi:hypothetical protein